MIDKEKNYEEAIDCLNELIQLDIDAIEAYEQAIKNIDDEKISGNLTDFKNDHKKHINELSAIVRSLGGKPTEPGKDFKGFLIKGMTAIQSAIGKKSALKAMRTNEKLTNSTYAKALEENLPVMARDLVQKNYDDEKRHLEYIESQLEILDKE